MHDENSFATAVQEAIDTCDLSIDESVSEQLQHDSQTLVYSDTTAGFEEIGLSDASDQCGFSNPSGTLPETLEHPSISCSTYQLDFSVSEVGYDSSRT